jgi:hypothetical protein
MRRQATYASAALMKGSRPELRFCDEVSPLSLLNLALFGAGRHLYVCQLSHRQENTTQW